MKVVLQINRRQRKRCAISIGLAHRGNPNSGATGAIDFTWYGDEWDNLKHAVSSCRHGASFGWTTTEGNLAWITHDGAGTDLLTLKTRRHAIWQSGLRHIMKALGWPRQAEDLAYERRINAAAELRHEGDLPEWVWDEALDDLYQVRQEWAIHIPVLEIQSMSDEPWWKAGVKPREPIS